MKTPLPRPVAAVLPVIVATLVLSMLSACGGAARSTSSGLGPSTTSPTGRSPAQIAAADSGRPAYTRADVDFISGMIGHHAQAVLMAGWAKSHGASSSVQGLAERI